MALRVVRVAVVLLGIGCASPAFAQQPAPAADPAKEPETLRERIMQPDQGGGVHFTKHFALVFGGIKPGSSAAVGPAFSHKFADGAYTQVKAVYSVRNFKLLQARYDSRTFWQGRAAVGGRLRWQDAPELILFPLGMDAPERHALYGERKAEAAAQIAVQLAPQLRVASGFGLERYSTTGGRIDSDDHEALPFVPSLPGLGTKPWFAHTFVSAAIDSRPSRDYNRRGRLIEAVLHDYRDRRDGHDSFRSVEGTLQQLVPTHGGRGVIDLSAHAWLSGTSGSRSVPFFLMPTLGGPDFLIGYELYRFRDRNALVLKGEYRWAIHPMVDVAGLYEAGRVAPAVRGLGLRHAASSFGGGIRIHTATSTLVSLDLAGGREGYNVAIGFTAGGS
jgi:hypothetical protein